MTRKCSLPVCDRRHYARGWCAGHYQRWLETGDTGTTPIGKPGPIERFAANHTVNDETGCWEWTKHLTAGYGRMFVDGVYHHAHRWSYEYHVGPIPEGLFLDHLCRNPCCVNPAHLEPVTPRENVMRSPITPSAVNARKAACIHGHQFTDENTYVDSRGWRHCRECRRFRDRAEYRSQRRAS